jgi:hypothetical protein
MPVINDPTSFLKGEKREMPIGLFISLARRTRASVIVDGNTHLSYQKVWAIVRSRSALGRKKWVRFVDNNFGKAGRELNILTRGAKFVFESQPH